MFDEIRAGLLMGFSILLKPIVGIKCRSTSPSKDVGPVIVARSVRGAILSASSFSVGAHSGLIDKGVHTTLGSPHHLNSSIGAIRPKGGDSVAQALMCGVCFEPVELTPDGYKHEDEALDKDHKVRPVVRRDCCS